MVQEIPPILVVRRDMVREFVAPSLVGLVIAVENGQMRRVLFRDLILIVIEIGVLELTILMGGIGFGVIPIVVLGVLGRRRPGISKSILSKLIKNIPTKIIKLSVNIRTLLLWRRCAVIRSLFECSFIVG